MRRSSLSAVLIAVFLRSLPAIADEVVKHVWAPAYDAAVEAGTISQ